jgi:hypothetical protein
MSFTRILVAVGTAAALTVSPPARAATTPRLPQIVDNQGRPVDQATLARLGYQVVYTYPTGIWSWENFGLVSGELPEAAVSSFFYNVDNPNDFALSFTTTTTLTVGLCDNSPYFSFSGYPDGYQGLGPLAGTFHVTGVGCSRVWPSLPLSEFAVRIGGGDMWSPSDIVGIGGPFGGTFEH